LFAQQGLKSNTVCIPPSVRDVLKNHLEHKNKNLSPERALLGIHFDALVFCSPIGEGIPAKAATCAYISC
jgi:hypothetical protein